VLQQVGRLEEPAQEAAVEAVQVLGPYCHMVPLVGVLLSQDMRQPGGVLHEGAAHRGQ